MRAPRRSTSSKELERRFGWGHLVHHNQQCPECDGTSELDGEDCPECFGTGAIFWGSFYTADHGECDCCKSKHELPIAAMYDGGNQYVCLRCYLTHHRDQCGCRRWKEAEACLAPKKPLTKRA